MTLKWLIKMEHTIFSFTFLLWNHTESGWYLIRLFWTFFLIDLKLISSTYSHGSKLWSLDRWDCFTWELIRNVDSWSSASFSAVSSVAQPCPTLCDSHGLQHARLPCPSPTPRACSNSCPLSWGTWYHPTVSSSFALFSSCPHSSPAAGSFQISQLFTSGG